MTNILALAAEALAAVERFHNFWDHIAAVRAVYEAALGTQEELAELDGEEGTGETGPELLLKRVTELDELETEIRVKTDRTTRDQQHAVAMLVVLMDIRTDPNHTQGWSELIAALKAVRGKGAFLWQSHYVAATLHPMFSDVAEAIGRVLSLCTEADGESQAMIEARTEFEEVCYRGNFNQCDPTFGSATWLAVYQLTLQVDNPEEIRSYLLAHHN